MTAKEYLKQAYLLDKQTQIEVGVLEQLRAMRGTIQGCGYGAKWHRGYKNKTENALINFILGGILPINGK